MFDAFLDCNIEFIDYNLLENDYKHQDPSVSDELRIH